MAEFKIFCNGTADLPEEEYEKFDVTPVFLTLNIGDDSVKHIAMDEFYKRLREGAMPTTSAVNLGEAREAFEPALKDGKDILCLAFSSGLSLSYGAMEMAAVELREEYPDRKIVVIDTLNASAGERIMIYEAIKMRDEGKSLEETEAWVEANKMKVTYWFSVDDLNHLKRGGRISATKAALGGMLNVKPILSVDKDGKLFNSGKVRGRAKSIEHLVEKLQETVVNPEEIVVYIPQVDCVEEADLLKDMILKAVKVKDVVHYPLGPVVAAHTGFGLLAVIFLGKGR